MKRVLLSVWFLWFSIAVFAAEKEAKVMLVTTMGKITVKLYNDTPVHRDNFLKLVQESKYDSIMFHRVIKLFMIQAGEKYAPGDTITLVDKRSKLKRFYKKVTFQSKKPFPMDTIRREIVKEQDYTLPAEIIFPKYIHKRGQLCAARQEDKVNPERKSSGTQFYIVTGKHYTDHELNKWEKEKNMTFTPEQREAYKINGGAPHLDGAYTIFGEVTKGLKVVEKIELSYIDHFDRPVKDIRIKKTKILKK